MRGGLGRVGLIAALVLASSCASVQAAWLQVGADAQQTSDAHSAGPRLNETAFTLQLPGGRPLRASPLIFDSQAYALVKNLPVQGRATNGIVAIDLSTGAQDPRHTFSESPMAFASDGDLFVVLFDSGVSAYPVAGGARVWHVPRPTFALYHQSLDCSEPLVAEAKAFVACVDRSKASADSGTTESRLYVQRIDMTQGTDDWTWAKTVAEETADVSAADKRLPSSTLTYVNGLSVGSSHVFVVTQDDAGEGGFAQAYLWSLDQASGRLAWELNSQNEAPSPQKASSVTNLTGTGDAFWNFGIPTAHDGTVFTKFQDIKWVDEATGKTLWTDDVRKGDTAKFDAGSGLARHEETLFVATSHTLAAFNITTRVRTWGITLTGLDTWHEANEQWHTGAPAYAGGLLYARAAVLLRPGGDDPFATDLETETEVLKDIIYAFDPKDPARKTPLWRHEFLSSIRVKEQTGQIAGFRFAVSDGVMVVQGNDGAVTVLGRTAASIIPRIAVSDLTPPIGEDVVVDLSGTSLGAFGKSIEYGADWGDGKVTPWTADPKLHHRYATGDDFTARFTVRNDAGQVSIEERFFEVAKKDPPGPWTTENLFAGDWQDRTLFVLGTLITISGAIFGFSRLHSRRTLLKRELSSVEDAFLMTNHIPVECESALSERKAHLRGLLLDNKLTEPQYTLIERRIDELRGQLRVNGLEDKFDFMPVGLMKQLQRILGDGHITKHEHQNFVNAIEANRTMNAAQRKKVLTLFERWFARDANEAWN